MLLKYAQVFLTCAQMMFSRQPDLCVELVLLAAIPKKCAQADRKCVLQTLAAIVGSCLLAIQQVAAREQHMVEELLHLLEVMIKHLLMTSMQM